MRTLNSTCAALTALIAAVTFTGSAGARGVHIGGMGAPMGHAGHIGHVGHPGHIHRHHGPGFGFSIYAPAYSYYGDDDCYRVYRHHHWYTVCD